MSNALIFRTLSVDEINLVAGGTEDIIVVGYPDNLLVEQFRLFRMYQPSLFGPNPDGQMIDPPPALPN